MLVLAHSVDCGCSTHAAADPGADHQGSQDVEEEELLAGASNMAFRSKRGKRGGCGDWGHQQLRSSKLLCSDVLN